LLKIPKLDENAMQILRQKSGHESLRYTMLLHFSMERDARPGKKVLGKRKIPI